MLDELPPFALERYYAPREFKASAQLSSSDCESLSLNEVVAGADAELRAAWSALTLGYIETRGTPLLRREIAGLYGAAGCGVDDVVTCVPAEGILLAMSALLARGDRVLSVSPAYQSLYEIARAKGCVVDVWRATSELRFDVDELRALVERGPAPRMIVVNFPHNPTGALPTRQEWADIVALARSCGAWLFSDEMYRGLEQPEEQLPSAVELYERGIALGGVSKSFSAPGLRVGWLATRDRDALERIAERKDYTTICGAGPSELLATMILRGRTPILERNSALVASNAKLVEDLEPGFTRPRAGCTALLRVGDGAAELCDALFRDTGVLALPSSVFDFGDAHVRLGLGRAGFARAFETFAGWRGRRRLRS